MTPKELRESRANILTNARKLNDKVESEKRVMNGEEQAQWDTMMSDAADLKQRFEQAEKLVEFENSVKQQVEAPALGATQVQNRIEASGPSAQDRDQAFTAWTMHNSDMDVPENLRESAKKCGVRLDAKEFKFNLSNKSFAQIKNASGQNVTTVGDGGYLVPEGFVANLEAAMLAFGGVLNHADVLRTNSGNDLPWPMMNDTGNTGALLAEDAEATKLDLAFTSKTYSAYKYTSRLILVSQELLEDSAINIPNIVGAAAGERLGRALNTAATTGTGSSQPGGIVTGAAAGVTAAGVAAITTDEVKNLKRACDVAYRPNAKWMFHDDVAGYLMKLKDGQSNYIWEENYRSGDPAQLLGHDVVINNDMSSTITASDITVLFGDISKHKVRMVNDVRLYRMSERYREFDQDGFVAFMRFDSGVLNAGGNPIVKLTQAAS